MPVGYWNGSVKVAVSWMRSASNTTRSARAPTASRPRSASLTRAELLELDVETILRRLFWQDKLLRFDVQTPRFACTCSRERVAGMIRSLGQEEADSIIAERGEIDVGCDFCGQHYKFDAIDAARIFTAPGDQPPVSSAMQ